MTAPIAARRIAAVRRFNRFYTRQIGLLDQGLVGSPFSLTEVRILYELAHREGLTARDLGSHLGLDAGYLSRILGAFTAKGLVKGARAEDDGRRTILALTPKGRAAFRPLETRSNNQVRQLLAALDTAGQDRLLQAMDSIESLLGEADADEAPYRLRAHRPGDMGWIVQRHGVLYAQEYGWDMTFEALVAEIVAAFIQNFTRGRDRCWVAERRGRIVGCIFCVRASDDIAKLRLLLVEPSARGLGLGRRLVQECIAFAQHAGYRRMTLWTNDVLVAARHIYEREGFRLVEEERHHSFGRDLVGQNWQLELSEWPGVRAIRASTR